MSSEFATSSRCFKGPFRRRKSSSLFKLSSLSSTTAPQKGSILVGDGPPTTRDGGEEEDRFRARVVDDELSDGGENFGWEVVDEVSGVGSKVSSNGIDVGERRRAKGGRRGGRVEVKEEGLGLRWETTKGI